MACFKPVAKSIFIHFFKTPIRAGIQTDKYLFDGRFVRFSAEKYSYVTSFNVFRLFASAHFIRRMHQMGKEVKVWTVNDPKRAPEGADGIITDQPELFIPKR